MGTLFLLIIIVLAALAAIGTCTEVRFWKRQAAFLEAVDVAMASMGPQAPIDAAFQALGLDCDHPLHPAFQRLLATDNSPESALDLIVIRSGLQRFMQASRQYATAVLLLCGIAGTLFSIQEALPAGTLASLSVQSEQLHATQTLANLQRTLSHAFWPSICGIVATLGLQLARYVWLIPAQENAGRMFVSVACSRLIPWRRRDEMVNTVINTAADRLEGLMNAVVGATYQGAEHASTSLERLAATVDSACSRISDVFSRATGQLDTGITSVMGNLQQGVQEMSSSLAEFSKAMRPAAKKIEQVVAMLENAGKALAQSADHFEEGIAQDGPFLQAIQQLYDSVSPAEAHYQRLLSNLGELQKLSSAQNTELARLYKETVVLAKAAISAAEGAKRMCHEAGSIAGSLPGVGEAVRENGAAVSTAIDQWREVASQFQTEVGSIRTVLEGFAAAPGRDLAEVLRKLPDSLGAGVSLHVDDKLKALLACAATSASRMDELHATLGTLSGSIDDVRGQVRGLYDRPITAEGAAKSRPKSYWWGIWKK